MSGNDKDPRPKRQPSLSAIVAKLQQAQEHLRYSGEIVEEVQLQVFAYILHQKRRDQGIEGDEK